MEDSELLAEYAQTGSEAAFRALVERHLNLVHGSALRQLSEPHLAEEVTQAVFILLARKAGSLGHKTVLAGWLFRTTRFVAARVRRTEYRRLRREQEAFEMHKIATSQDAWERIAPVLDEALEKLGASERDAVLLRFIEGRNHREVGAALGLTEEAARKRVDRALEKLRGLFANGGLTLSATALGAVLLANTSKAAPVGFVNAITATAVASGPAAASTLPGIVTQTLNAWQWAKVKLAGAVTVASLLVASTVMMILSSHGSGRAAVSPSSAGTNVAAAFPLPRPTASVAARLGSTNNSGGQRIRFHVLAQDNDDPVSKAKLIISTLPLSHSGSFSRAEVFTDMSGAADIPLPTDMGRLDISLLAPGWGARFGTWRCDQAGSYPSEYTMRVERLTNSIGGWLRDESGNAVAGAEVWIQFGGTSDYAGVETPRERPGVFDEAFVAVSDRQGRWDCMVIPTQNRGFGLEAYHPDFAPVPIVTTWQVGSSPNTNGASLKQLQAGTLVTAMKRGMDLSGRVTDASGRAVAGARFSFYPGVHHAPAVLTDVDGKFAFHGLREGLFAFTVNADGFSPEYRTVQVQAENEPLEIKLQPGSSLRLKVVDRQGAPVPDVTVHFERLEEMSFYIVGYNVEWQSSTDDEGRAEWRSAPGNKGLLFSAWKEGWCQTSGAAFKADGEEHTITLDRGVQLSGHVTDEATGLPVSAFKVTPIYGRNQDNGPDRFQGVGGGDGIFKLTVNEARAPWRVRVEAEGYVPITSEELSPMIAAPAELKLKPVAAAAPAVRGTVLKPDGNPLLGATVALLSLDYNVFYRSGSLSGPQNGAVVFTDEAGSFSFSPNPRAHSVAAVGTDGYAKMRLTKSGEPIVLQLQAWGRIEGTVADFLRTGSIGSLQLVDATAMNYSGAVRLEIETQLDESGRFKFEKVPPGRYALNLTRGLGVVRAISQVEVTVRPGETSTARLEYKGARISGKLVGGPGRTRDADGRVLGAIVLARPQNAPTPAGLSGDAAALWTVDYWQSDAGRDYYWRTRYFPAQVDTNKFFVAEGVEPGNYSVQAWIGQLSSSNQMQIKKVDLMKVQVPAAVGTELDLGTLTMPDLK